MVAGSVRWVVVFVSIVWPGVEYGREHSFFTLV